MPKKIKLDGKVHKIAGKKYVMIQITTGEVYLCGNGSFGKFLLPTKMECFRNLNYFSIGEDLGIIKTSDSKIYIFGANHYGKLAIEGNEEIKCPKENKVLTNLHMDSFEDG